jgi:hypothetical protein
MSTQDVCVRGLFLHNVRLERNLRGPLQLVEGLAQRLKVPLGGVQFGDFTLIELLLARESDKIRRRFAIRRPQSAQARTDVAQFLGLLGKVLDRSLGRPDTIGVRVQGARALCQRQVNCAHLLATKIVQQISTRLAEDFVGNGLNFGAAVGVQRQKRASVQIDIVDRPSVRSQKNGLLLERPLNCVPALAVR